MTAGQSTRAYQVVLVGLLCLNFGILFFDRNALNFLMPFIQPDLGLSYTEVGLLGSALSLTWALAASRVLPIPDAAFRGLAKMRSPFRASSSFILSNSSKG